MYKIYLNGNLYKIGNMPETIPGVKLSRLNMATDEQLLKHGITYEAYTPLVPEPPTEEEQAEQFQKACEAAIQSMLDAKAAEWNYESINNANGWTGELPEADNLKKWGGRCWRLSQMYRDEVLAGERPMPESVEEFMQEIPTYDEYMEGGA